MIKSFYKTKNKENQMKKLSLIAATLLLMGTSLYATEGMMEAHGIELDPDISPSPWSFKAALEERYRPTQRNNSKAIHQSILRLGWGYTVNEDISLFGEFWGRNRQTDGYTTNNDWVTAVDAMAGIYYEVNPYISPYAFYEMYYDAELADNKGWSGFGAIGFTGTLFNSNKHTISYYYEYYFALGKQSGPYEGGFENFDEYGSEIALKYNYAIYDNVSFYFQPTWYVYGAGGLDTGNVEYRVGINISL
jgi:hypothetical protein